MTFADLLAAPQYSLTQPKKEAAMLPQLRELTRHHRENCAPYGRLLSVLYAGADHSESLADVPFVPISLFKTHRLASIPDENVFKTLTSSGTTGQQVSQIVLDGETARRQTIALSRIMTSVLGPDRLPMIMIESESILKDRLRFNARAAGVLGMMNFGRRHFYALDDEMNLNEAGLLKFLAENDGKPFLIFGFTFMVWQYFFQRIADRGVDLSNGILVHSGGWKKLHEMAVSNTEFRSRFAAATGLTRIYNFYGMAEQVGSVFLEGDDGYLYPPNFADVIIRDPMTFREQPVGEPGVIQVLSLLPGSYPGHSILTEDLGVIRGVDDSTCGRAGKYFSVLGRVPKAELRGCSDVHASQVA
jgi:phenylacetate-coenzyme A ligase PaaK-like adenylate-forming protein